MMESGPLVRVQNGVHFLRRFFNRRQMCEHIRRKLRPVVFPNHLDEGADMPQRGAQVMGHRELQLRDAGQSASQPDLQFGLFLLELCVILPKSGQRTGTSDTRHFWGRFQPGMAA